MNIINAKSFIEAVNKMHCGETPIAQINSSDFVLEQENTFPLPGFEPKPGYPHCCNNHTELFNIGLERFMKFPDCCDRHRQLHSASWFKKEDYSYLPRKIVDTVSFTMHCIGECIEKPHWYKEITDYIYYTAQSFGQFPENYGPPLGLEIYLFNVESNLSAQKNIDQKKKKQIIGYIKEYGKPSNKDSQTDLNLLMSTYKEWLKIFPFELSFFSTLKPQFEKQIPILNGKGETNIYTGMTGFKVVTIPQLIESLVRMTTAIIKQINTYKLHEEGLLTDAKKVQIELIMANRRLEIESLDAQKNADRNQYIKLLKTWMKGEKTFLKEITPLLKDITPPPNFTNDLIEGIKMLQKNDCNEPCIMNVRENRPDKETGFRYWFKNFFKARYPDASVTAEEEQGKGRIDLKVILPGQEEKIIEFKGWWNHDKTNTAEQICNYLTDFEKVGYVFMINHLKKTDIKDLYKNIISTPEMNYIENSWREIPQEGSAFMYYESNHQFAGKEKLIRHFIFNVYF